MNGQAEYLRELFDHGFHERDASRFESLWEHLESAYLDRLAAAVAPYDEWKERFRAGVAETARLVETYPTEARFLVVDSLLAGDLGRNRQRALASRLAEWLDSAREELPDPDSVPAATSSWVVAFFFNRVYRRCTVADGPDLPSQLPEFTFLAISAYFGTEAGLGELVPPP